jgi:hypothetical protein
MAPAAGAKAKSPTTDAVNTLMDMRLTFMLEPLNDYHNGVSVGPQLSVQGDHPVVPLDLCLERGPQPLSSEHSGASGSTAGKHPVGITGSAAPWSARRHVADATREL